VIFIVVKFKVKPEWSERWPALVADFTEATRQEPGNLWFDWSRSLEDPNEYVLVEAFKDDAAGEHVNSAHFKQAMADMPQALAETPRIVSRQLRGRRLGPDGGADHLMWIGWIEFDILLGDVQSLKEKRSVVRPLIAEVKRRFDVSVAEVGDHDQYRRTRLGVGLVAADRAHLVEVLAAVERLVAGRPEIELLSARQRDLHSED
jgi:uncharacterized protein YlxP (DUF503 family)/quinol monooxygenase YgiN